MAACAAVCGSALPLIPSATAITQEPSSGDTAVNARSSFAGRGPVVVAVATDATTRAAAGRRALTAHSAAGQVAVWLAGTALSSMATSGAGVGALVGGEGR